MVCRRRFPLQLGVVLVYIGFPFLLLFPFHSMWKWNECWMEMPISHKAGVLGSTAFLWHFSNIKVDMVDKNIVARMNRSYLPTRCSKWIFVILIVLVDKKHTKLIYHMPWFYQYPPLPFHRPYKKQSKILKYYPPYIMEVLKCNVLISIVIF